MIANWLSLTVITAPMVFLVFGAILSFTNFVPHTELNAMLHSVAEVALVILLFLDAAKTDQRALLKRRVWPARMLALGLPIAFVFGTGMGLLIFPGWSIAAVALVAAILVPTDAALGQTVVDNPDIPERSRRALTVESGLNDGLALPLVLLMAFLAAPDATAPAEGWLVFALKQVTLGPLVGGAIGMIGGSALLLAKHSKTTSDVYEGIGALSLAASAYFAATLVDGNGFIAAFAAGLAFGSIVRGQCAFVYEFTEGDGQLVSWAAFFLLGLVLVPSAIADLTFETTLYILGSLFLVRPLAIWLSLLGTDASGPTRLFFGWFGPRGLATALFALVVAEEVDNGLGEDVLHIAVNAVWISAVLHGLSAAPGAKLYARLMTNRESAI